MNKTLQYMMSKKGLPIVGILLVCGLFFGFKSWGSDDNNTTARQEKIVKSVATLLKEKHYSPKNINDAYSKIVFKKYLSDLDPEKNIFTQSDINALKKYETTVDDEINGGKIDFFTAVNDIYNKRLPEVISTYRQILAQPFDFTVNEKIQLDQEQMKYAGNEPDRKEIWRKRLKYMALERYSDLIDQREANKGKDSVIAKSDAELEKDARARVLKVMDRNFERLKLKFTEDERFSLYINAISESMDPYTSYFAPVEKRAFDEQMKGSFFGIGAQLREDEGVIKVVSLVTGSPAWKSGEIQINDIFLKVAQGNNEPVDLAGFAVEDAVKLIRGNKGTEVRLTIKKSDGSTKVVSLIRDEIKQDETYARSAIINQNGNKIGYIYLPEFYADFEKQDGNRCSMDVAAELIKLKSEKVDGVILDLRNNGGGFLTEVTNMVGLFIKDGPVVQVKDRDGTIDDNTWRDRDASVLYDGPLVVMVNELSASASEIFAAAIQDYRRGLIVGSNSTYGKGSVQRTIPFGRPVDFFSGTTDLGALKITLQKYYRVNGGSVQMKGVIPDVVIPDMYQYLKIREKDNENALPWDEIKKSEYQTWNSNIDYEAVKRAAAQRINSNAVFSGIQKNAEWLNKNADKQYDLSLSRYKEKQKQIRAIVKENDTLSRLNKELDASPLESDKKKYFNNEDKAKGERYQQWLKSLKTDIYVDEATKVMSDMINSQKGMAFNK
jgi:carboxyl-terminal processing protease